MKTCMSACKYLKCSKEVVHGKIEVGFQNTAYRLLGFDLNQKSTCYSTLRVSGKDESVPTNVLVRSIAYIVQKTDRWDSLLKELCVSSSSEITPPVAVQVIKRIKKPQVAFEFFKWLDGHEGFSHDSLSYSAIIKVLSKEHNPSQAAIAEYLLRRKIDLGLHVIQADYDCLLHHLAIVRRSEDALLLFDKMISHGFNPSVICCKTLLLELFRSKQEDLGWELFNQILDMKISFPHFDIVNVGMKHLCVKGRLEEAMELFAKMKTENRSPNSESFNILIKGCCEKGEVNLLCKIFKSMLDDNVKPNSYTMNLLIKRLCKEGKPEYGNRLFYHMRKVGWIDRKFVYSQLVESLCDYGWWLKALKIFVKMVRRGHHPKPDLYNNLVRRLCMGGRIKQAFELKDLTLRKGFLKGVDIYNGLINGLCLSSRMDLVEKLLVEIHENGLEFDSNTYNLVLHGHHLSGNAEAATKWADRMREVGLKSDTETSDMLLSASIANERKVDEAMEAKTSVHKL